MPVRSLNSSILKWPNEQEVVSALRRWATEIGRAEENVRMIGYFGSYARGDWGVGSDLDVVIVVESSGQPFERRGVEWDTTKLPVPVDLLVYTVEEWRSIARDKGFAGQGMENIVWVFLRSEAQKS